MMLLVILLLISVALNVGLVFGMIRKRADEDMMTIRLREGLRVEWVVFKTLKTTNSFQVFLIGIWSLKFGNWESYSSVIRDSTKIYSSSSLSCLISILFGLQHTSQSSIKSWFSKTVRSTQISFSSPQYWQTHFNTSSVCILSPTIY